ncbi:hypothetical protein NPIL_580731 [Nephila pilipes]|uniref:Uncharacterized protein n=1 Tax=Nephila pilipes TaxID=299642 RepID=A0A8X6ULZ2_NEPPI|nr:hypothetical protein NPIL_580731 [Nephila pilipes]
MFQVVCISTFKSIARSDDCLHFPFLTLIENNHKGDPFFHHPGVNSWGISTKGLSKTAWVKCGKTTYQTRPNPTEKKGHKKFMPFHTRNGLTEELKNGKVIETP